MPSLNPSRHVAGNTIGPFELIRSLGHGGMGEVWLARQADGRIGRDVALKLPAMHQLGPTWRARFGRERDILARLEHPHIARLYDAGIASGDQPWLAMEYVAGPTLSGHLAPRVFSIPERVALFRQVLAAVAHAHRHLVVHRDLKPANVLIDAACQVKLLDFGIAKLVDDGADEALTGLAGRVMTLRYAAPEQVAGESITTATDIYALGVILHELVTGLSPYAALRQGRTLTDVMLVQEQVGMPSRLPLTATAALERGLASPRQLARTVAGDLDAIVLKALRREPAERYASVELLDQDLAAWLEKRPVKARPGTWRYLAGRFAARHKLPLALAATAVVTLLAGLVVADGERRIAVAQKARAERHFAGVRTLANAFMFDVHGEIEGLEGSLEARRLLVSTSLKYLASLSGESAGDAELGLEVATAYRKIAVILGDNLGPNLGEPAAARRNAETARTLLARLEAGAPGDIRVLRERLATEVLLSRILKDVADPGTLSVSAAATAIADRIAGLRDATRDDRKRLAATLSEHALNLTVVAGDRPAALATVSRAVELLEELCAADPSDFVARANLAAAHERASTVIELSMRREDLPAAIDRLRKSIVINEALALEDPLNQAHEQALVKRYANLAGTQDYNAEHAAAGSSIARALEISSRVLAREPGNSANAVSHLRALAVASGIEHGLGAPDRAEQRGREAIAFYATLPEQVRNGLRTRAQLAVARSHVGAVQLAKAGDASLGAARRLALAREARGLFSDSRAFRLELVTRNIDVAAAKVIAGELGVAITRCDELIAGLAAGA
jgi:eukaryotic-like serine/threonine-protein kinase